MRAAVFFHVYLVRNWREIVGSLVKRLRRAGLWDCPVFIGAIGAPSDVAELAEWAPGAEIRHWGEDGGQFEFPTIGLLHDWTKENDGAALYIHTKGVTQEGWEIQTRWRNTMADFVIDRWRECVAAMEAGAKVCGVRWRLKDQELPHILAGNFFWTRCDYARALPRALPTNRYECENWILSARPESTFEQPIIDPLF